MMRNLITTLAMVGLSILGAVSFDASAQEKEIAIVAHRGFWNNEQAGLAKNSVAGLEQAQKNDFWGSEFDVNMTKDGKLLVFHDGVVEGVSIERNPASKFDYFRLKNGEPIPTLDQYLEQAKKYPETMLVFELKKHLKKSSETKAVKLSLKALEEHGLLSPDRVMFISFSKHICKEFARLAPGFTVQYLEKDADPDELIQYGINGIDIRHSVLRNNKQMYARARANNMSINTWTVNKEEDIRKMIELGVDQITSDYPLLVRQLLQEMGVKEKRAR
jgi:glycerophosphoryl diester phosphodiesterase